MKKLYVIPIEQNFIETFTDYFLNEPGTDLSRTAVVFPGKRAFLYLNRMLAEKIKKPFFPPKELTITEFITLVTRRHLPDFVQVKKLDAVWMIYEIARDLRLALTARAKPVADFREFYPWAGKILEFIDLMDRENVQESQLKNIKANAEIGYDVPETVNLLLSRLIPIRQEFHKRLKEKQLFTTGLNYQLASQFVEQTQFDEFDNIYFSGLFALTGIEKQIIKNFYNRGKASVIWHGHPEKWEKILKPLADFFQGEIKIIQGKETSGKNSISIYSGTDVHSQVVGAHQLLRQRKIEDMVIVLPLADTLFPLLSYGVENLRKNRTLDNFNISMGYPLNRTSLFTLISQMLEIQKFSRQQDRKGDGSVLYNVKQYADILSSPFIKNLNNDLVRIISLEINKALTGGIEKSRLKGLTLISLHEISRDKELMKAIRENSNAAGEDIIIQTLQSLHSMFFHDFEDIRTLRELCEKMEQVIDHILANSDVRSYILSGEVFNCFFQVMNEIKKTALSGEKLDKELILNLFLFLIDQETISFETKPLQELEIIGMLETRNLNFRNVMMLDVQEGVMPEEKKIDPLIPAGLYNILGLPDHEKDQEIYRYHFTRLIRGAENVHLFYIQDEDKQRSRYIEEIIWEKEKEEKKLNALAVRKIFFPVRLISSREKEILIPKDKVILDKLKKMKYSASSLNSYLECRLKFYFEKILNLKEQKEISEDIDQAERGILVHHILRDTVLPFMGQKLDSRKYPEIESRLLQMIEKHFLAQPATGEYYLFRKITENHLKNFFKKDLNREFPFKVLHAEKEWESSFPVHREKVVLKGFIDRIDWMQGRSIILDYKTGMMPDKDIVDPDADLTRAEKIRENIFSFQLPVYIYLYLSNESSVKLENLEAGFISLLDSSERPLFNVRDLEHHAKEKIYKDFYLKALKNLVSEILDPEEPFSKYKDVDCRNCPFIHLCGMEEEEKKY